MAPLSWRAGAVWTIVLGSTFFLVYGTCNWITSLRTGVPSFYWAWERSIPFVPAMVVPYMSLDLFFAGAIFLCAREEIGTHAKRVFLAIFVAAACFLLFPLRFAFVRPATAGFAGMLFDWLKLDQPYNQFPSLHIALCSIVWAPYRRRSKGPLRWILAVWFLLIGLSPLLTYQHHAIDLIGGGILTVIVFYLFPGSVGQKSSSWQRGSFHFRATLIYGVPALLLTLIAFALRPWGLLLLWPACSLALVAAAYAGAGPQVFRKCDGVIPWAARVLLGPYLLGARISREAYRRTADVFGQVTPSLLLGGKLTSQEARHLVNIGVTAVLDLAPEYSEARELLGLRYESIQVLDWTVPTSAQLQRAVSFIDGESRTGKVYVHCALGFSRSAGVVAAYLLESSLASTAEEAVALIRKVRPQIVVTSGWMRLLRARMPVR